MQQIIEWIVNHWELVLIGGAALIQITPVKWCPLETLAKWLGKIFSADVMKKVTEIQADIVTIKKSQAEQGEAIDANEKDRIRYEVLDFANSCRNGRRHTQDEFEHIIALNGKYDKLLQKTGDTNGVFTAEYEYIMTIYRERQIRNDFL